MKTTSFGKLIHSIRVVSMAILPASVVSKLGENFNRLVGRRDMWMIYYFKKDLSRYVREFALQSFWKRHIVLEDAKFWNMYMQVLIESQKTAEASRIFLKYQNTLPDIPLTECYLQVSNFLITHKLTTNTKITHSCCLYQKLLKMHSDRAFNTLVNMKSVAIVGNGPIEIGTGNGLLIDSYDVVIRFNNYSTDSKYSVDYGSKTTIRAIGNCTSVKRYSDSVKLEVFSDDLSRIPLLEAGDETSTEETFASFATSIDNDIANGKLFDYVDVSVRTYFTETLHINPTTGLLIIELLKNSNAKFVDAFGFSFLAGEKPPQTYQHYQGDAAPDILNTESKRIHDPDKEFFIMKSFFEGRRLKQKVDRTNV